MNDRPQIQLQIDRLILDGISLSQAQRPLLQTSVETELGRLMMEGGIEWGSGGSVPSLSTPAIQLSPGGNPTQWGHQIAHAVYQGMNS
jgi:hypothetical protein